ncbi:MAG: response regulator [Candidatus Dormibacteraeota bacterium]|uniref:Response regulator n=1 Tax=Candidatus Aeolococcus gillhamiae TaxID=3127015 RepID=A0A934N4K7_9BACT|nr:response regulator [Candidatus Dormibacteraeota bacterium]
MAPPPTAPVDHSLILVIDDDPSFREFLTIGLSRYGLEVSAAVDGIDGLAHLAARRPVAIVTDMRMPRLDGLEFCLSVRAQPAYGDIPIVVLTNGDLMGEPMLAVGKLRMVTPLAKTVPMKDLVALVGRELAA